MKSPVSKRNWKYAAQCKENGFDRIRKAQGSHPEPKGVQSRAGESQRVTKGAEKTIDRTIKTITINSENEIPGKENASCMHGKEAVWGRKANPEKVAIPGREGKRQKR